MPKWSMSANARRAGIFLLVLSVAFAGFLAFQLLYAPSAAAQEGGATPTPTPTPTPPSQEDGVTGEDHVLPWVCTTWTHQRYEGRNASRVSVQTRTCDSFLHQQTRTETNRVSQPCTYAAWQATSSYRGTNANRDRKYTQSANAPTTNCTTPKVKYEDFPCTYGAWQPTTNYQGSGANRKRQDTRSLQAPTTNCTLPTTKWVPDPDYPWSCNGWTHQRFEGTDASRVSVQTQLCTQFLTNKRKTEIQRVSQPCTYGAWQPTSTYQGTDASRTRKYTQTANAPTTNCTTPKVKYEDFPCTYGAWQATSSYRGTDANRKRKHTQSANAPTTNCTTPKVKYEDFPCTYGAWQATSTYEGTDADRKRKHTQSANAPTTNCTTPKVRLDPDPCTYGAWQATSTYEGTDADRKRKHTQSANAPTTNCTTPKVRLDPDPCTYGAWQATDDYRGTGDDRERKETRTIQAPTTNCTLPTTQWVSAPQTTNWGPPTIASHVSNAPGEITLTWEAVDTATRYYVEQKNQRTLRLDNWPKLPSNDFPKVTVTITEETNAGVTTVKAVIKGLEPGMRFEHRVRAWNKDQEYTDPSVAKATTTDALPAPKGLSVIQDNYDPALRRTLSLSWDDVGKGKTTYQVQMKQGRSWWQLWQSEWKTLTGNSTPYTASVSRLNLRVTATIFYPVDGRDYQFQVRTVDQYGYESDWVDYETLWANFPANHTKPPKHVNIPHLGHQKDHTSKYVVESGIGRRSVIGLAIPQAAAAWNTAVNSGWPNVFVCTDSGSAALQCGSKNTDGFQTTIKTASGAAGPGRGSTTPVADTGVDNQVVQAITKAVGGLSNFFASPVIGRLSSAFINKLVANEFGHTDCGLSTACVRPKGNLDIEAYVRYFVDEGKSAPGQHMRNLEMVIEDPAWSYGGNPAKHTKIRWTLNRHRDGDPILTTDEEYRYLPAVVMHEFGHTLGLADLYLEPSRANTPAT